MTIELVSLGGDESPKSRELARFRLRFEKIRRRDRVEDWPVLVRLKRRHFPSWILRVLLFVLLHLSDWVILSKTERRLQAIVDRRFGGLIEIKGIGVQSGSVDITLVALGSTLLVAVKFFKDYPDAKKGFREFVQDVRASGEEIERRVTSTASSKRVALQTAKEAFLKFDIVAGFVVVIGQWVAYWLASGLVVAGLFGLKPTQQGVFLADYPFNKLSTASVVLIAVMDSTLTAIAGFISGRSNKPAPGLQAAVVGVVDTVVLWQIVLTASDPRWFHTFILVSTIPIACVFGYLARPPIASSATASAKN